MSIHQHNNANTPDFSNKLMSKPFSRRELRLLHLIDNAKLGMVVIDQSHQVLEANQRFADMLGYTLDEVRGLHTWDWESVSSEEDIRNNFVDLSRVDFNIETKHRRKDGSLIDVEVSGTGYNFGDTPENNVILCFCQDISERMAAQRALMESEQRFKSYVENSADILLTSNTRGIITYISPNCEKMLGYGPEELTGKHLTELISDDPQAFSEDIRLFLEHRPRPICENQIQHKNGSFEWYSFRFSVIDDVATSEPLLLCVARNITYQKEHQAQLEYLSMHDQLTGVYNRAFFFEELSRNDRQNLYPLSVVTYDLDDFKQINDRYGHAVGDEALITTARAVSQALRKHDVFARIGGDEFSILLPGTPNAEAAIIAQRIRVTLTAENARSEGPDISISIGVATKSDPAVSMNAVLQTADQRMYQEKNRKKAAHPNHV
jgi:diguanylate cyclase (GGDEF)-like protein/PAS domain S-box-containing protein